MFSQSIEALLPLLQLLEQPAFCVGQDGRVFCNPPAKQLAPTRGEDVSPWLGDGAETYAQWDRKGPLTMAIALYGSDISLTLQPLKDGTLFLLSPFNTDDRTGALFASMAQVVRIPLESMTHLADKLSDDLEELEDPLLQEQAAGLHRQLYRLNRLTCNLADLDMLRSGSYPVNREKLELLPYLTRLTRELEDLLYECGRKLEVQLPAKSVNFITDPVLLERAVFNLISNAVKYGKADEPVRFSAELTPTALLLQVRNACADPDTDLLTAAFRRTQTRGLIPDPRWGMGLGLPVAHHVAQLLGGTVTVELRDGIACVTLSVSRKRAVSEPMVKSPSYDYTGGMSRSLIELSDCLPSDCYDSQVL